MSAWPDGERRSWNADPVGKGAMSGDWIKYAELGIAALIPIMTLVVGIIVLRLGTARRDQTAAVRIAAQAPRSVRDVAPKLNDIFCFFQVVGHWADLDPDEIIDASAPSTG